MRGRNTLTIYDTINHVCRVYAIPLLPHTSTSTRTHSHSPTYLVLIKILHYEISCPNQLQLRRRLSPFDRKRVIALAKRSMRPQSIAKWFSLQKSLYHFATSLCVFAPLCSTVPAAYLAMRKRFNEELIASNLQRKSIQRCHHRRVVSCRISFSYRRPGHILSHRYRMELLLLQVIDTRKFHNCRRCFDRSIDRVLYVVSSTIHRRTQINWKSITNIG